ncbi:MAG: biotin transporter BioY [candidate division WOR-3 bacterium]
MLELALRRGIREALWFDPLSIFLGAGLIAALSRLSVPLPFSPVPITGQTLGVLLIGAALGSRKGFLCVMVYLAAGVSGVPVFALGGAGPGWVLGPTGGYLMSFPAAAALVGFLAEKGWMRNPFPAFCAMVLANLLIYLVGALWLSAFVPDPIKAGVLPFIPGDAIKAALAAFLVSSVGKRLGAKIQDYPL